MSSDKISSKLPNFPLGRIEFASGGRCWQFGTAVDLEGQYRRPRLNLEYLQDVRCSDRFWWNRCSFHASTGSVEAVSAERPRRMASIGRAGGNAVPKFFWMRHQVERCIKNKKVSTFKLFQALHCQCDHIKIYRTHLVKNVVFNDLWCHSNS